MNVQFAVKDETVYVLEVNPRASRTTPFVSKAIGVPLGEVCGEGHGRAQAGGPRIHDRGPPDPLFSVKEAVFPFNRFPGVDITLGPEMKSTGEVMGIDMPTSAWPTPRARWRPVQSPPARGKPLYQRQGFRQAAGRRAGARNTSSWASSSTPRAARTRRSTAAGVPVKKLFKLAEGRPNVLDMIKNEEIAFIINTPSGKTPRQDEVKIRGAAVTYRIPIMTTLSAAAASVNGIRSLQAKGMGVKPLQEYHPAK